VSRPPASLRLAPIGTAAQREYWADNLRVVVIAAVVVFHTATAYLGGSSWYFMQRTTSGAWSAVVLAAEVVAVFALGPLFLVAGWYSGRSLAHRGAGAFARARLLRLGIPLIAFIFLVNGLAGYVGHLGQGPNSSLAAYLGSSYGVGPMWFVAALLAFSLAYAMFRRLRVPSVGQRRSPAQVLVAAAVLIAVTGFAVWQRWPLDDGSTFLDARWAEWPQGAVLFALGVWAGGSGGLEELAARARPLGWTALAAVASLGALLGYENARGNLGSTLRGAGWPTMLATVLYGIISVAFTVWFTALIRSRWSGNGPLRGRAGQASYATYFLHPLVLTAIMVPFASVALAPELKFVIVAVVAVPVCFVAGYALTRLPGIFRALVTAGRRRWSARLARPTTELACADVARPMVIAERSRAR
jgi:glucans biosynthesis protein C